MVAGLTALALSLVPAAAGAQTADRPAARPNIIVIVADDLGYADLGCQGGKQIPTPNIDSLARNGVRMTSGYVTCPVCSPTRAGLTTGRYQQRFGHEFNPGQVQQAGVEFGLPLTETTLADRLKSAGYTTGIVGKWHLGQADKFHPLRRGFDEFFGFLPGAHPYLDLKADSANPILRGTETVDEKAYLTDAISREAVAFIDRHARGPFFLYLTYNAVHTPMQATEKYLARFESISEGTRRTYAAMLSAMDDGVGEVLAKLRQAGVEQDTLIFFISDNGGPTGANASRNDPLRGNKAQLWEGGIRVPFMMQWKNRLPAGKVYAEPVISLDILPTAVAAAGGQLSQDKPLDGVDVLPYLTGQRDKPPHEALFWRFGPDSAVRKGNWKLLRLGSDPPKLFDLAADIGENSDLADKNPDKVKELDALLKGWDSQLAKPLWGGRGARGAATAPAEGPRARRAGRQAASAPGERSRARRGAAQRQRAQ